MSESETPKSNVPEFSVGELAFSLKKTLEENFGRVRVRGELSRISVAGSGHMYSSLKDENAVIDAVCWKGQMSKLSVKPEEGLEVVCTGRISSYPKSSKYQLIIETMELAGEGALLKMLEERRKKLSAEGLFDETRKKPLPFLPDVIGVVTSPTGAVIRDILHRVADRFPRRVILWPVLVQGDGAAAQITAAINGFNALPEKGKTPRPDVLIIGRGGGSLEDLMAFNEENVVRATANSEIPIISAVGHETDTTLIDFASDLRAPTPTGAAEMAVPVRMNIVAQIADDETRLINAINRAIQQKKSRIETLGAKLGDPSRLLELKIQRLDQISDKLNHKADSIISKKSGALSDIKNRLLHPAQLIDRKKMQLDTVQARHSTAFKHYLSHLENRKTLAGEKLELLSFKNVLNRGFTVIRDEKNKPVTNRTALKSGQKITIEFKDEQTAEAEIIPKEEQGSLF